MESPVVLDKPPEYHGNDRGFPFEEEEGSGAWSSLAARHPDIAARLRQRPATATWARKRRPSSQDNTDDFGENFSGFDRFPFDDIPPEFREHFPSHWNRRFSEREEPPAAESQPPPQASPPQHHTAGTQTELPAQTEHLHTPLTQHGLRNTVDLGQKSPADPSLVDADERTHRSMSAPPDHRPLNTPAPPPAPRAPPAPDMPHPHRAQSPHAEPAKVRHIPIFVEGRDEPVINKTAPAAPPPQPDHRPHEPAQPHTDRDQYFDQDDHPSFHHPSNFSRAFGTPFNKGFRQGPQPFAQQKVYPQAAFNRGASPQRAPSPSPPPPRAHDEHYVKVPVHHEHAEPPKPHRQPSAPAHAPPREPTPPQQAPPKTANDPISQILRIQTDVLDLMTEVENFKGTKKDKRYLFLDEMLTRNLIKLDDIETEGKENIRQARKEAVRCIEKCIAVLESKAEKGGESQVAASAQTNDVEMEDAENGEVASKDEKTDVKVESQETQELPQADAPQPRDQPNTDTIAAPPDAPAVETKPSEQNENNVENKPSPKKKVVKKRDKSKDKAPESTPEAAKDSNKVESHGDKVEVMQVDNKGETEQVMEVDGAASQ